MFEFLFRSQVSSQDLHSSLHDHRYDGLLHRKVWCYKWDDIKHLEAELALSLERRFENAKLYIKPGIIQTLTEDDNVSISGLKDIDTYKDSALGRVEIGGNYNFNYNLSTYGWINYTYGSNYNATALCFDYG